MNIKKNLLLGQLEMLQNALVPGEVISPDFSLAASEILSNTINELKVSGAENKNLKVVNKADV